MLLRPTARLARNSRRRLLQRDSLSGLENSLTATGTVCERNARGRRLGPREKVATLFSFEIARAARRSPSPYQHVSVRFASQDAPRSNVPRAMGSFDIDEKQRAKEGRGLTSSILDGESVPSGLSIGPRRVQVPRRTACERPPTPRRSPTTIESGSMKADISSSVGLNPSISALSYYLLGG